MSNIWSVPSSTSIAGETCHRDGSRISGKGVCMYKGVGIRFADFI